MSNPQTQIQVAITWCLLKPHHRNPTTLETLRNHFYQNQPSGDVLHPIVTAVRQLDTLAYPTTVDQLKTYTEQQPILWENAIGLVYGGATKIKPYVFDVPKLHEIRGASALLDSINLIDLPAFFSADRSQNPIDQERFKPCYTAGSDYGDRVRHWLESEHYSALISGLIPELIIYSTGGNILAFCPPDLIDLLADSIEKRYTTETLIANSCAVGEQFRPLEIRFGLLPKTITDDIFWLEKCQQHAQNELVKTYIKIKPDTPIDTLAQTIEQAFCDRKSFNELTSKLAIRFNQRRAGNAGQERSSTRRYPAMLETHPYLQRDNTAKRTAILRAQHLPNAPWHSEASARKRIIGQQAKKETTANQSWYYRSPLTWQPPHSESWVKRFDSYLNADQRAKYYGNHFPADIAEAQTVGEIGNASNSFVAYIYADGNNMGGYIQTISTPQAYREFSEDISKITEESVYESLAEHLSVHCLKGMNDSESTYRNQQWIHPFEVITIGGDDVFLIVPADRALQIAKTIGEVFERRLMAIQDQKYHTKSTQPLQPKQIHRYQPGTAPGPTSLLSMSTGVLITADSTPIIYAEQLTEQLLKSAKEKAKQLKNYGYTGGTIDILTLKSVTMISSNISEFRKEGLVVRSMDSKTHTGDRPKDLHLYATPYTLHEIGGLITLVQTLKSVGFPRSQLYQIRSFLEKGKRTAILNYRYFRIRLDLNYQNPLLDHFESSWCAAKESNGNIAPWMYAPNEKNSEKAYYETIWRELVDLYDFIPIPDDSTRPSVSAPSEITV